MEANVIGVVIGIALIFVRALITPTRVGTRRFCAWDFFHFFFFLFFSLLVLSVVFKEKDIVPGLILNDNNRLLILWFREVSRAEPDNVIARMTDTNGKDPAIRKRYTGVAVLRVTFPVALKSPVGRIGVRWGV